MQTVRYCSHAAQLLLQRCSLIFTHSPPPRSIPPICFTFAFSFLLFFFGSSCCRGFFQEAADASSSKCSSIGRALLTAAWPRPCTITTTTSSTTPTSRLRAIAGNATSAGSERPPPNSNSLPRSTCSQRASDSSMARHPDRGANGTARGPTRVPNPNASPGARTAVQKRWATFAIRHKAKLHFRTVYTNFFSCNAFKFGVPKRDGGHGRPNRSKHISN